VALDPDTDFVVKANYRRLANLIKIFAIRARVSLIVSCVAKERIVVAAASAADMP
jgi:hypothetical protein